MKAVVVYESLWGNTAAVARAIADGIGPEARALPTNEATTAALADADLIVAGAPLLGFSLPTDKMREGIRVNPGRAPAPPDLTHPPLRAWLAALPKASCRYAAFETRLRISPGSATGEIDKAFAAAGYQRADEAQRFIVKGKFGPLKDGELEKARAWGAELAKQMD
jgi:flavodoxin